jgi:hypothetical protein
MPNIIWIWDMVKFTLSNVLIQTMAIKRNFFIFIQIIQFIYKNTI